MRTTVGDDMAKVIITANLPGDDGADRANFKKISPSYFGYNRLVLGWTEEQCLANAITNAQAHGLLPMDPALYWLIETTDLPDEYFFDAWEMVGGVCGVNHDRACDYHMGWIKIFRNFELDRIDKAVATLEDQGLDATAERAKRQPLRDIPADFMATLKAQATPAAIKAQWPANVRKIDKNGEPFELPYGS